MDDIRKSAENGSRHENASSAIESSAAATALSEVEKRDIARKAALAEAEIVLRVISYTPSTSLVKKDIRDDDAISNGAEKADEGEDDNAGDSADGATSPCPRACSSGGHRRVSSDGGCRTWFPRSAGRGS